MFGFFVVYIMFDDVDDFDVDDKNKMCISLFTGKGAAAAERTIEKKKIK